MTTRSSDWGLWLAASVFDDVGQWAQWLLWIDRARDSQRIGSDSALNTQTMLPTDPQTPSPLVAGHLLEAIPHRSDQLLSLIHI